MEIKNLNSKMITAYKGVGALPKSGKGSPAEKSGKPESSNFDKVEIDFGRATEAAKANIAANITEEASAARIAMLQSAYEGENLPVTPQQLADSILA
jgi:hypothetical protein